MSLCIIVYLLAKGRREKFSGDLGGGATMTKQALTESTVMTSIDHGEEGATFHAASARLILHLFLQWEEAPYIHTIRSQGQDDKRV